MAGKSESRVDNKSELMCIVSPGGTVEHYKGYRHDFITQTLSPMESQLIVCRRCAGIIRDACSVSGGMAMVCATCVGDEVAQPVGAVREMVAQLKCRCPLTHKGCEWEGIVRDVSRHLDQCLHVMVPCPYSDYGCEEVMKRLEIARHREVSKEWHTELTGLFLAGRVEQQAKMIKQLQADVHFLIQEKKYLKLNGIIWKLSEDAIRTKLDELRNPGFEQQSRADLTDPFNPLGGRVTNRSIKLKDRTRRIRRSDYPEPNGGSFYTGPRFLIEPFDFVYPQLCFENFDRASLCVTKNPSTNVDFTLQQPQHQFRNDTMPLCAAASQDGTTLLGKWEVIIVNNQDTERHWKVEVGHVDVTARVGFKLTDIPADILLDKKYYLGQNMEIRILCKSD